MKVGEIILKKSIWFIFSIESEPMYGIIFSFFHSTNKFFFDSGQTLVFHSTENDNVSYPLFSIYYVLDSELPSSFTSGEIEA